MPYEKTDKAFVEDFKSKYLAHLKAASVPNGGENQARIVINKAVEQNSIGLMSRVFDALKVDVADFVKVKRRVKQAKDVRVYLAPILQELASVLLVEDRSRVSDAVIDAIGIDKYKALTSGDPKKEKQLAETLLKSTVVLYNGALTDSLVDAINNKTMPEKSLDQYKHDLSEVFMTPAGKFISNFSIDEVLKTEAVPKAKVEKKLSLTKLQRQAIRYLDFLTSLQSSKESMSEEESLVFENAVNSALMHVKNAIGVYNAYIEDPTMMPKETAKSIMATNMMQSMEAFVEKIDPKSLTVKPSKTYTDILNSAMTFFEKLHALCTGVVAKDKIRAQKEEAFLAKMKDMRAQIIGIENNFSEKEQYNEASFKSLTSSTSSFFGSGRSSPVNIATDLETTMTEQEQIERAFTGTTSMTS